MALLTAAEVPLRKELILAGSTHYYHSSVGTIGEKLRAAVYVEFENLEAAGLGVPLPKGVVRVYKKDRAGNAQFVGEDQIDHTPARAKVRLKLGNAFDITANKRQTDFRTGGEDNRKRRIYESAYEATITNAKKESVTVLLREPMPGDWRILEESHSHEKVDAHTAQWRVTVPAGGEVRHRWRVQTRF